MKNRILGVLLVLLLIIIILPGTISAVHAADAYFEFDENTGSITGYIGNSKNVEIPDSIGGIPVIAIGKGAFEGNRNIKSITIPASVKKINDDAFRECMSLQDVTVKGSDIQIWNNAFYDCNKLVTVNLEGSVKTISDAAFGISKSKSSITVNYYGSAPTGFNTGNNRDPFVGINDVKIYVTENYIATNKTNKFCGIEVQKEYLEPIAFTITYTDGVEEEVVFIDKEITVKNNAPTPAYGENPSRTGYEFVGWSPDLAESVTKDQIYTAQWTPIPADAPDVNASGSADTNQDEHSVLVEVRGKVGYDYSYQWYSNTTESNEDGAPIHGATDGTYQIPADSEKGEVYYFYCVVTATRTDNGQSSSAASNVVSVHLYDIPKGKELTYSGMEQALIEAGVTAACCPMEYALTDDPEVVPTDGWSESVPTAQKAGKYYIYYRLVGKREPEDFVTSTIEKAYLTASDFTFTEPDNLSYDGTPKSAIVEVMDSLTGVGNVTVKYYDGDGAMLDGAPGDAGTYMVKIDVAESDNYSAATALTHEDWKFTIVQKEISISWGATEFMPYNGNQIIPKASAVNLINEDVCELTVKVVETNEGAGIIPGRWHARITELSNENYCLPQNGELVEVEYGIVKGYLDAPAVFGISETVKGKGDGSIAGLTTAMEYASEFTADDDKYTEVTDPNMTFVPGTYYVRYQAEGYYNASTFTEVTIAAGRKLKINVPQNQVGYTLTVDVYEFDYLGNAKLTFILKDGYSKTDDFSISLNGNSEAAWENGSLSLNGINTDINIVVTGVEDITAPVAEISVKDNKWTDFFNNITFDLFFKESTEVTITAADAGSGLNTVQYYLAGGAMELVDVKAITHWTDYEGAFKIDPDNEYVVYAKVTDNAGNTVYLNSDGVVLDQTNPVLVGIYNGESYWGNKRFKALDDYLDTLKIDGVDVTGKLNGDNEYTIVADNREHVVTVTDKAGNVTEYKVTVYKNYTVTFKVDGETFATETVGHGKNVNLPAVPEKDGYIADWDNDGKGITGDIEIKAVYSPNKYTITFDTDGGSAIDAITQDYGTAVTAPANPTKIGYTFAGWVEETGQDFVFTETTVMGAEDILLTAKWNPAEGTGYTVMHKFENLDGTFDEQPEEKTGTTGEETEAAAKTVEGFTAQSFQQGTIAADGAAVVEIVYTRNEYTLTFQQDNGEEDIAATVKYGAAITAPADPAKTGYTFAGWGTVPATMPADDVTLTAQWTANRYTITFDTDGGSVIDAITQDYGTAVTAPVNPTKTGYTFAGWDKVIPATMPAENVTVKALWEEIPETASVIRLAGATRYDTAIKAADELKAKLGVEKLSAIIVTTGEQFADALAGSYLAVQKDAPILLVRNRDQEMNQVKDYIKANLTSGGTVYLLGGEKAVSKKMETGLDGFQVKRLGGKDRYATNLLILQEAGVTGKDILVSTGKCFADSLSASAVGLPILLVKDQLNEDQKEFLKGNAGKIYIIGGKNAVSEKIENQLKEFGSISRLSGKTRYETSVLVAEMFFVDPTMAVIAYGDNFPDGLSGGPLAHAYGAPLILTREGGEEAAAGYLKVQGIQSGYAMGGTAVLKDKTVKTVFSMNAEDNIAVK